MKVKLKNLVKEQEIDLLWSSVCLEKNVHLPRFNLQVRQDPSVLSRISQSYEATIKGTTNCSILA